MLHFLGLSHFAQSREPHLEKTEGQKAFTDLLEQTIKRVHPIFVAEEDSAESLAERKRISIAQEVADRAGIEHRFCDPDQAHRKLMGYVSGRDLFQFFTMTGDPPLPNEEARLKGYAIERGRYFPVRERYWLDRLQGCREQSAIFICGYGHLIDSFLDLLDRERLAYSVVQPDVGVTEEERRDVLGTAQYLRDHPELRNWNHKMFPLPRFVSAG
jgi:hypothetical protein